MSVESVGFTQTENSPRSTLSAFFLFRSLCLLCLTAHVPIGDRPYAAGCYSTRCLCTYAIHSPEKREGKGCCTQNVCASGQDLWLVVDYITDFNRQLCTIRFQGHRTKLKISLRSHASDIRNCSIVLLRLFWEAVSFFPNFLFTVTSTRYESEKVKKKLGWKISRFNSASHFYCSCNI